MKVASSPAASYDDQKGSDRPLKICVVFEDDVSASSAEVLIKHVASVPCEMQPFQFDELDSPAPGVAVSDRKEAAKLL